MYEVELWSLKTSKHVVPVQCSMNSYVQSKIRSCVNFECKLKINKVCRHKNKISIKWSKNVATSASVVSGKRKVIKENIEHQNIVAGHDMFEA